MQLTKLLAALSRAAWRWGTIPPERWTVEATEDGGFRLSLTLRKGEAEDDRPKIMQRAGLGAATPPLKR